MKKKKRKYLQRHFMFSTRETNGNEIEFCVSLVVEQNIIWNSAIKIYLAL